MRVAVIGGGIGGLAVARGLQAAGADVTVFERSTSNAINGSGLSLFANGVRALEALGYGEALSSISGTSSSDIKAGQRLPNGKWLARTPEAAVSQLRIVHRVDLSEMLAAALRPGTVWNGADVSQSVRTDEVSWSVELTDSTSLIIPTWSSPLMAFAAPSAGHIGRMTGGCGIQDTQHGGG